MNATWTVDRHGAHWLDRRDIGMQLEVFRHFDAWLVCCCTVELGDKIWAPRFTSIEEAKRAAEEHANGWTPRHDS